MLKLPPFGEGQRIGLFGGSFNPAHYGHYAVALYALRHFGLDWVWWLVSPQNPLKDRAITGDYETRLAQTRSIARHPRFVVTDIERQLHSPNTITTLEGLGETLDRGRFIFIMGADSLAGFHRWHWADDIAARIPLGVVARPGFSIRALNSPTALRYDFAKLPPRDARLLPDMAPPAWCFLTMPLRKESSTAIRAARRPRAPAS